MMKKNPPLLSDILRALIRNFGHAEVTECLSLLAEGTPEENGSSRKKPKQKRTAVDLVRRMQSESPKKDFLLQIADQFDRRNFLPRIGDIQHFLKMRGREPVVVKKRDDAFRTLLSVMDDMPEVELGQLARECAYMGPSLLGPLSEAIAATSTAIRSEDKSKFLLEDSVAFETRPDKES